MLENLRQQLAKLLEERAALATDRDAIVAACEADNRPLNEDEQTRFDAALAAVKAKDTSIEEVRGRVADLEEAEVREQRAAELHAKYGAPDQRAPRTASTQVVSEPETYRKGGRNSYFRDLARASLSGSQDSIERLRRNDREVASALEQRALSTTDGGGGEFVPPLWMVDEYVALARSARVVANRVRNLPLPAGTDSINLPRVATGTSTAEQTTQNTAVSNTDATTNSVTANVATIAGQQVVSQQLIEQSPINIDDVLLADLAADYATKLDIFCINNNAANKRGLLNVSGSNAVTFTTPVTVVGAYPKVADAIQQIHTGRFLPADVIFMHPRRWAWIMAAVDGQSRPLAVPAANAPQNVLAAVGDVAAEGFVGAMQGLPVFVDPNIPTNLGTGTNEDRIIVARSSDVILFEGTPRSEAFRETKADQLSVLLRFYNYCALHSERYPKSISVISGAGLIAPTF